MPKTCPPDSFKCSAGTVVQQVKPPPVTLTPPVDTGSSPSAALPTQLPVHGLGKQWRTAVPMELLAVSVQDWLLWPSGVTVVSSLLYCLCKYLSSQ